MPTEQFDYLAIGSGLAGLTFALHAAHFGTVCVLTKAEVAEANTSYAQGGIAAAVGEADSWKLHEQDTLIAGAGLCDPEAVRFLVQQAPSAIEWLASMGAKFDLEADGDFALGREGGHSRHRILHHADKTGWEIERAVVAAVRQNPQITVIEHAFVTHLFADESGVTGAVAELDGLGNREYRAKGIMLATGGCGQMYQHTTNPRVATGDGIGLAIDLGARVENMEFMQFHPTTFYHPQMRSFLITEAVRGAGGSLRNHLGRRFFYVRLRSALGASASRHIAARSMEAEMQKLNTWCLYLDMAHLPAEAIEHEFPMIRSKLQEVGVDPRRRWIPVVPAQHYSCGGVKTDLAGRTTVKNLYAAGEVASTGVHGAIGWKQQLARSARFCEGRRQCSQRGLERTIYGRDPDFQVPQCIPEAEAVRIRRALKHRRPRTSASFVHMKGFKKRPLRWRSSWRNTNVSPMRRFPRTALKLETCSWRLNRSFLEPASGRSMWGSTSTATREISRQCGSRSSAIRSPIRCRRRCTPPPMPRWGLITPMKV